LRGTKQAETQPEDCPEEDCPEEANYPEPKMKYSTPGF